MLGAVSAVSAGSGLAIAGPLGTWNALGVGAAGAVGGLEPFGRGRSDSPRAATNAWMTSQARGE